MKCLALLFAVALLAFPGHARGAAPGCIKDPADCPGGFEFGTDCGGTIPSCVDYVCMTQTLPIKAAGTTCQDDGNVCTTDQCDGAGHCVHAAIPMCTPPPECTSDANCADLDSTTACAKTVGVCTAGKCVASTTSTPCTTTGGGGGGCSLVGPRGAAAGFVWMLALIAASCLHVRRRRA